MHDADRFVEDLKHIEVAIDMEGVARVVGHEADQWLSAPFSLGRVGQRQAIELG